MAAISGLAKTPSRAASSRRRTAAASSVESGMRPPIQRGTALLLPLAPPHPGRHVAHLGELQRAAGEDEALPRPQAGDERLLDRAEPAAADVLHVERGVAGDGADRHPVPPRDGAVGHGVEAVPLDHPAVFGVGGERRAAAGDEVERPVPLRRREVAVGPGGARPPRTARRRGSRRPRRSSPGAGRGRRAASPAASAARSGRPPGRSRAAATSTSSKALVGTQVTRLSAPGWWPLRPARCARRAIPFGLPTCSTRSTGEKSTPRSRLEVQTTQRSAPALQARLHEVAHLAVERAVMEGDLPGPVGPSVEDRLVPDLRLRAGVGEDERRPPLVDRGDHLRQQLEPEVPGPGEALDGLRDQRVDADLLGRRAADQPAPVVGPTPSSAASARVEIAQRGREPQVRRAGPEAAQPGEGELGLRAALVAQQLVPLVDHHAGGARRTARGRRRGRGGARGSRGW